MKRKIRLAYSYVRWSTAKQTAGKSKARQDDQFLPFCRQHGLTPADDKFIDKATSGQGKHLKGQLGKFIELAEQGVIPAGSVLVVEELDRVSRMPLDDGEDLIRRIMKAGISVAVINRNRIFEPDSWRDISSRMQIMMELDEANSYVKRLTRRVSDSWYRNQDEARATNRIITKAAPHWFDVEKDPKTKVITLTVNRAKAKTINAMFAKVLAGDSVASVLHWLIAQNKPVLSRQPNWKKDGRKNGKPKRWNITDVWTVLTNRAVIGEYQPTRKVNGKRQDYLDPIEGQYEAIVPLETFRQVQQALKNRRTTHAGRRNPRRVVNLFTGLVFEQLARKDVKSDWFGISPMNIKPNPDGASFVPRSCLLKKDKGNWRSFPYDGVELAFRLAWAKYLPLDQLLPARSKALFAEIKSLRAERGEIEERIDTINRAMETTKKTQDEVVGMVQTLGNLAARKTHLLDEEMKIQHQIDRSPKKTAQSVNEFFAKCDKAKPDDLRELRERLKSTIAECVQFIHLDITHHRRYTKQAYITILLRNPHSDAVGYRQSSRLFIPLLVMSDRNHVTIWNKADSDKGLGGYRIDRRNGQIEETPPHSSSLKFLIDD
jgi:DNA invertase Pin-like site-specific DNA recombinase